MKLFTKPNSKFYWYDFTVRGFRYRGSTQETKSVRALQVASLKLASVLENADPLPSKPPVLGELAERFLDWFNNSRLEEKTKKFYRNGWRLLKVTSVAVVRVNQITGDCAEQLTFPASAANANCACGTTLAMGYEGSGNVVTRRSSRGRSLSHILALCVSTSWAKVSRPERGKTVGPTWRRTAEGFYWWSGPRKSLQNNAITASVLSAVKIADAQRIQMSGWTK